MKSALSINGRICELLNSLHGNQHLLKTSTLNISNCQNVQCLQSPSYISRYIDLNVNTHLVKQKSDLCKNCFITASTIYTSLGCHRRKELKMHFSEFVYKKGRRTHDDFTQRKLDHGTENEVKQM